MVVIAEEWLGWLLKMLAVAKGRKEIGLMVAGVLEQPRDVWSMQLRKGEFSWLLRGLQPPRGVGFGRPMPPNL
ncbi:hypothetical protein L3X38_042302 [Prunus dulcis]|uniref:Uncharacterized protein n=1 Tax=Prunus dulcis TaxID=3755 RepID=A0AAD4UUX2_PRUDU|nr:hypothetical protein L3X38_042302 [Prunus dulcis]